jgi:ATP-dependent Clp protease protease subunit
MKKPSSKAVDISLEYLVDVKNGIIPLIGEVNEDMYAKVVASIIAMSHLASPPQEITFLLSTYGGDLYSAFAIYDMIKRQEVKTKVMCNGPVMSAGTIIMQAADERVITPRSYLMYHFGSQVAETQQCVVHFAEITKDVKQLYQQTSKASKKTINGWFEKETYYNAKQALELGLVDRIDTYAKEKNDEART